MINVKDFKDLKAWFDAKYGESDLATIECNGKTYIGYMYGDDTLWDTNEFYQYFLTEDALYRAYFDVPEGETDMGNLDYDHACNLKDADAQYYIDYVI